ncbi:ATP-binding protein [Cellulomonas bogoriensis]|uniref:Histidine kinase n=1 Tax=Cellulomonas bogoriensis 69B4 = DSM 16987 TaxID=1386082 RepID=A0A0A0C555_9CELL|nr:ATP-binding protein [Cellulomonas bogoriensis]KGM14509.1 histidine kinase [Cellulomonas bogoriensis 69B4 = DSM 16987]
MRLHLDARRGSVGAARHWVRDHLTAVAIAGQTLTISELLTSELVANAVLHGCGAVTVEVSIDAAEVVVTVRDQGEGVPVARTTGPEVPGGQGVRLVERLAARWGVEQEEPGKAVWFAVARG